MSLRAAPQRASAARHACVYGSPMIHAELADEHGIRVARKRVADAVLIGKLGVDHRRAVHAPRAAMDRLDLARQIQVHPSSRAPRPLEPGVEPAPRDLQHSAHDPDRMGGLVGSYESEERFEVPLSCANQAAAFERISRSSLSLRFSRRSRLSSSRSALVKPPSPLPASRASCFNHSEMVQAVGPNSLESDAGVRPERTRSTICRLNSGVYRTDLSAIVDSSKTNHEVSTKAGQVQS